MRGVLHASQKSWWNPTLLLTAVTFQGDVFPSLLHSPSPSWLTFGNSFLVNTYTLVLSQALSSGEAKLKHHPNKIRVSCQEEGRMAVCWVSSTNRVSHSTYGIIKRGHPDPVPLAQRKKSNHCWIPVFRYFLSFSLTTAMCNTYCLHSTEENTKDQTSQETPPRPASGRPGNQTVI